LWSENNKLKDLFRVRDLLRNESRSNTIKELFWFPGGPAFSAGRRKSVFAETYDPEEDEHEEQSVKLSHLLNPRFIQS